MVTIITKRTDIDVEIDMDNVQEIISSMDSNELAQVSKRIGLESSPEIPNSTTAHIPNSLDAEMKNEWWECAKRRYTLDQLEAKLGKTHELDGGHTR